MIQARKIQYMCMSKLSAKELANRAHQFLADGDKKKQQLSTTKDLSNGQEGINFKGVILRHIRFAVKCMVLPGVSNLYVKYFNMLLSILSCNHQHSYNWNDKGFSCHKTNPL